MPYTHTHRDKKVNVCTHLDMHEMRCVLLGDVGMDDSRRLFVTTVLTDNHGKKSRIRSVSDGTEAGEVIVAITTTIMQIDKNVCPIDKIF